MIVEEGEEEDVEPEGSESESEQLPNLDLEVHNKDSQDHQPEASFESVLGELVSPPDLVPTSEPRMNETSQEREVQLQENIICARDLKLDNSELTTNSQAQYKTYYKLYKEYCEKNYLHQNELRYDVNADKVLRFFEEVIFKRTMKKYFYKNQYKDVRVPIAIRKEGENAAIINLAEYLQKIPADAKGKKVLEVPCGSATVEQAMKALCHLQRRQSCRSITPNTSRNLRECDLVTDAMERYCRNLVMGDLRNQRDLANDGAIRNTYSKAEHIQVLLDTWGQPLLTQSPWMREHFVLAIRHSMLLRDKDIRRLNLSDCFMDQIRKKPGGTQAVSMLVIALHQGKPIKAGEPCMDVQSGMRMFVDAV
ncbi:hypothetical protein BGZ49_006309 [Haplosporangium sp. Z 27]|nr:hypothetical protein BGZ49_006309 [Haplosporangium sp. Z 27]